MENLKKIREKNKISQIRLSIDLEVSQETISAPRHQESHD